MTTKISTKPKTCIGKLFFYKRDFHYIGCFSKRLSKTGSVCPTKYEVPEKEHQNVFLTMRTGTLNHTPFLYIYIKDSQSEAQCPK